MKIGEIPNNSINPPSAPDTFPITTRKMENQHPSINNQEIEIIDKFLKDFFEENKIAIKNLAEHINEFAKDNQFSLKFIPEKEAGVVIIKIFDSQGNLIRQIPPEEVLTLSTDSTDSGEKKGFLLNFKM